MPHRRPTAEGFRLLVSPTTTSLVDVTSFIDLAKAADTSLRRRKSSFGLDAVVLFPIIADPTIYTQSDFLIHKRASNAYYVGRNIDFHTWQNSRKPRRLRLALENLTSCVEAIPDKRLSVESKAAIAKSLQSAAEAIQRRSRSNAA